MLKEIVSIYGESGLFRLISSNPKSAIIESLKDKKRRPLFYNKKNVALGEVALYTDHGEEPLGKVFEKIKTLTGGKTVDLDFKKATPEELKNWFGEVVEDYDRERVYHSDIKKIISWFNQLIEYGIKEFYTENKEENEEK